MILILTGILTCFVFVSLSLHLFFLQTDGSLYTATPVDHVFIWLPIFEEARMKVDTIVLSCSCSHRLDQKQALSSIVFVPS